MYSENVRNLKTHRRCGFKKKSVKKSSVEVQNVNAICVDYVERSIVSLDSNCHTEIHFSIRAIDRYRILTMVCKIST